jgi:hypothetical protein
MEREICISIEIDFDDTLEPEWGDDDTWREVQLSIAAEYEQLGVGEVQGHESFGRRFVTTAYTTRANWDPALTIAIEALRQRDLMHAAIIKRADLTPKGTFGQDVVVWPVV